MAESGTRHISSTRRAKAPRRALGNGLGAIPAAGSPGVPLHWSAGTQTRNVKAMSMNRAYSEWIAHNVVGDPRGLCKEVTERMAAAFPELRRVRGHYVCPSEGRLQHWWLVAADGTIVDPTKRQFVSDGKGAYEPHEGPVPTGKCLNCGEYVYECASFCSPACQNEFTEHIQSELG
jgi:hypothetical protein